MSPQRADYLKTGLAIIFIFIVHTYLPNLSFSLILVANVYSIVVIYSAFFHGELFGAFTGLTCGLLQDSFSFGVFGVAGIAKTVTGYVVGSLSKKIDISSFLRKFFFFSIVLSLELLLWGGLYFLVYSQSVYAGRNLILLQPFVTAFVASSFLPLVKKFTKIASRY